MLMLTSPLYAAVITVHTVDQLEAVLVTSENNGESVCVDTLAAGV